MDGSVRYNLPFHKPECILYHTAAYRQKRINTITTLVQATFEVSINSTIDNKRQVKYITAYTDKQLARLIRENKQNAENYYMKVFNASNGEITVYNRSKKNWIKS